MPDSAAPAQSEKPLRPWLLHGYAMHPTERYGNGAPSTVPVLICEPCYAGSVAMLAETMDTRTAIVAFHDTFDGWTKAHLHLKERHGGA